MRGFSLQFGFRVYAWNITVIKKSTKLQTNSHLGKDSFPKNYGISSHWWGLEIPEPCEKQSQTPLQEGPMIRKAAKVHRKICHG